MTDTSQAVLDRRAVDTSQQISVRTISQISLQVKGPGTFKELQRRVLRWVSESGRNVRDMPEKAWQGESFEIDNEQSERVQAVALQEPRYWALRLSERLRDGNRVWITDIAIAEKGPNEVVLGCRLLCSERGVSERVTRSIPRFVRGIVFTQNAWLDGRIQGDEPWLVDSAEDVDNLIDLLAAENRKHPVVVFSLPEGASDKTEASIDVTHFIRRTAGGVHSVVITPEASRYLTDRLGHGYTVYNGAIRTYYPGFDPEGDLPTDHPFTLAERIPQWADEHEIPFEDFLVDQTLRPGRRREELERDHPPFQQIKRIAADRALQSARHSGQDSHELLRLAEEEIEQQRQEVEEMTGLLVVAEEERENALARARQIQGSYHALQARLEVLEQKCREVEVREDPIPESFESLESWARKNLSGRVEIHERALKAARASDFDNVELAYKALLLLRDYYVPMKIEGGKELRAKFVQRCEELRLEDAPCFTQEGVAQNFQGEYFVQHRGERRELDRHLKGSNSRERQRGFRLYYFWEPQTQRVIVGHFPGHLKNNMS